MSVISKRDGLITPPKKLHLLSFGVKGWPCFFPSRPECDSGAGAERGLDFQGDRIREGFFRDPVRRQIWGMMYRRALPAGRGLDAPHGRPRCGRCRDGHDEIRRHGREIRKRRLRRAEGVEPTDGGHKEEERERRMSEGRGDVFRPRRPNPEDAVPVLRFLSAIKRSP